MIRFSLAALALFSTFAAAQQPTGTAKPAVTLSLQEAAERFGELSTINAVSLSPDGERIAYISPLGNGGTALLVVSTQEGAAPKGILKAEGENSLQWCNWANANRLVCGAGAVSRQYGMLLGGSTVFAIDADGQNLKSLSVRRGADATMIDTRGGQVIDWLPDEPEHVLMMRSYVPEERIGSLISKREQGMGVDRVDINTAASRRVETPRPDTVEYITDGNGTVRIIGNQAYNSATEQLSDTISYSFRDPAGKGQQSLGKYNVLSNEGFNPYSVDRATNRVIGFKKIDGRQAVVAMTLDGQGMTQTLFSHPEVDIDGLVYAGPRREVVGATFVTEKRQVMTTDGKYRQMTRSLGRALGGKSVFIGDQSLAGDRLLVWAGSDRAAGTWYLYAPAAKTLRPLLDERPPLKDVTLAEVRPIRYPAADGTMIPGYLTLPPGRSDAKGLPAVVMPHGGPSARDEWGFDWLAQFLANQGYAVVQPNFRGSSGYGDAWYQRNGFQSWRTAIGDVTDAGRWLIGPQGADPNRLSIVGWSYGGYAALQSGVLAPSLFRKIVAIAPVTSLAQLRREEGESSSGRINRDFIGAGPHIREGSPAENAAAISAPVLMFHGSFDQNVAIAQARTMRGALRSAGKSVELIEYNGLTHSLEARAARQDMLARIGTFLAK